MPEQLGENYFNGGDVMGVSGPQGVYLQGTEKVKEEIAELEKRRQKLYKDLSLPGEVKRLTKEIASLTGQRDGLNDTINALLMKKKSDLTEEVRGKIKKVSDELIEGIKGRDEVKAEARKLSGKVNAYKGLIEMRHKDLDELTDELKQKTVQFKSLEKESLDKLKVKWDEIDIVATNTDANKVTIVEVRKEKAILTEERKQLEIDRKSILVNIKEETVRLEAFKKQAYSDKNKADDYSREKRKKIDIMQVGLEVKQGEIADNMSVMLVCKHDIEIKESTLQKDQNDLKTNWDMFKEAQQNLGRRNLKLRDREDKVKKKESEMGLTYNG